MTSNGLQRSTTVPATDNVLTVPARNDSDELRIHQVAVKLVAGFIFLEQTLLCDMLLLSVSPAPLYGLTMVKMMLVK